MHSIDGFPRYEMADDATVWYGGAQVMPYYNKHRGLLIDLWDDAGKMHTVRVVELINAAFPPSWRKS